MVRESQCGGFVPISEIARLLCPGTEGHRFLAMLSYYCDESYDKRVYTVAGLVASDLQWKKFERRWNGVPQQEFGVSRFHASPLNCYDGEFAGWTPEKSRAFTKRLIKAVTQRQMVLVSCSVFRKPYDKLPEQARDRLGSPYELCFKHCIALVAQHALPRLEPTARFSVVYDRNKEVGTSPVRLFELMREDETWPFRHRLVTCAPGSGEDVLALQPADMVAFDTFKLLHESDWSNVRKSLRRVFAGIAYVGVCFDEEVFKRILPKVLAREGTVIVDPTIDE